MPTRTALPLLLCTLLAFASNAHAKTLAEQAEDHLDAKRYSQGLALAKQACAQSPDDVEANGVLGRALFRLHRLAEAREALERTLALAPDTWGSYCRSYLARIAFYLGEDDEVRKLIATLESDNWVRKTLGKLLAPEGMRRRVTRHYVIYTHEAVAKVGGDKRGAQLLELIYKAYSKVFPYRVDSKRVHRVYLFPRKHDLRRFTTQVWGSASPTFTGVFYGDQGALLLNTGHTAREGSAQGFSKAGTATLFHEAFHQFIDMHASDVPDWLNEGLAEYFETAQQVGRKKKLAVGGVHHARCRELRRNFGRGSLWSMKDFLRIGYKQFHSETHESVNYSQAWSLVHFLLHGPSQKKGRKLLKSYFAILRAGRPWQEAHAETFADLDLDKMERAWINYVNQL